MRAGGPHRRDRFLGDQDGAILVELMMAVTMLALLAIGGAELSRYLLVSQKLDRVASSTGDLISRADTLSESDINDVFAAAAQIVAPFHLGADGVVIVSSISATGGNPPQINWQRSGAGTLAEASMVGVEGGQATLPNGMVVNSGETVIVTEVFYNYVPWPIEGLTTPSLLYSSAAYRPRFGGLTAVLP